MAEEIDQDYLGLEPLIANMYETMYNAQGVGLAAPQIGRSIRLFVIDASPFAQEGEEDTKHSRTLRLLSTLLSLKKKEKSGVWKKAV